jgi:metal transporter CNNM
LIERLAVWRGGLVTWLGILFCLSQSAMFSGLNLAFFSVSVLRLEIESATGNRHASKVRGMRRDANFLLTTILWGNVGINVLLTLLSDSVMSGVSAFFFSSVAITFLGEIVPQAYFSRHALRMGSRLAPLLRFYQILLYPVAKPCALLLDRWLGPEGMTYFRERELRELIRRHIASRDADIDRLEGIGALNFLAIDDLIVSEEGERVDPLSVIVLPTESGDPVFPAVTQSAKDPFVTAIGASGKRWIIIADPNGEPVRVLDASSFLRDALLGKDRVDPKRHCHRPIVVRDATIPLGRVLGELRTCGSAPSDDVVHDDVILVWGRDRRVITGADVLGRLLRGISRKGCP